jgi:amino acid adenylation domain-containing protein
MSRQSESMQPGPPRLVTVDYDPFAAPALARVVPTSEAQREVWLAASLGRESNLAYNESSSIELHGSLDRAALLQALQDLVDRHDALRASTSADGLQLLIAQELALAPTIEDLSQLDLAARDARIAQLLRAEVETPFDLVGGPLIRARLLCLAPDRHQLVISAHHIVCDGWSFGVLAEDLAGLYSARCQGKTAHLTSAPSYGDYALSETQSRPAAEVAADESYWTSRFRNPPAALDLPTDRPRTRERSFASRRLDVTLPKDLHEQIKRLAGRIGASPFAVLLSGFAALLSRLSAQSEVVIGVPSAGQLATGQEGLVGHCVNLLPLRLTTDASLGAAELVQATQAHLLDAFEHQRYTFGTLLRHLRLGRDPSRPALVSVLFNVDQSLEDSALGFLGLAAEVSTNPRSFENFELFVNLSPSKTGLEVECQYNSALFERATIARWIEAYVALLRAACADPMRSIAQVDLVDDAQQRQLEDWNSTAEPFDLDWRVTDAVRAHSRERPDAPALSDTRRSLTYRQLDSAMEALAARLRAASIGRGKRVGLCLSRGVDMVVAQLAVLHCGAAYVPLDPGFPRERLAFMARDARLDLLLSESALRATLDWSNAPLHMLDEHADTVLAADLVRRAEGATRDDPAYIIYTSGSTGRPKGVVIPHAALANFLHSMARKPGLGPGDRLLAITTLSFDIAVLELLLPLTVGAEVVIAEREQASDGVRLAALLESSRADVMQATPATWRLLLDAGWRGSCSLRALVGGESLSIDLASSLRERVRELWNMYGPTETTVWSSCWRVEAPATGVSIGAPIANTSIWILDPAGKLCPIGVAGEIWIGGIGVALGYLDRPELTAERFVADHLSGIEGGRLYRTGDRGRWRADGRLEHLGRLDAQIKLRGFRIELGEIESVLTRHPSVVRCVAALREMGPGDSRLIAYIVARDGVFDQEALRVHLRRELPDYMLPQHLQQIEAVPLLPNGKIDRNALPAPAAASVAPSAAEAPRTESETIVAEEMAAVLRVPSIGRHEDFFLAGGHSLLAAQLAQRLSRRASVEVSLRSVFESPTVAALAALIERELRADSTAASLIPRRSTGSDAPLSLMQQRIYFLEQLTPGRPTYNTPSGHRLFGPLDQRAFAWAVAEMVRRQSALRTVIGEDDDGMPIQIVRDTVAVDLFPVQDLASLPASERERELERRLAEAANEPFDLRAGPLFRARLYRLAEHEHVFLFMVHHIVWDGWSIDLLYEEMAALYQAALEGKPSPLPELAVDYQDFSAWQRAWMAGERLTESIAHWRRLLGAARAPLELPRDRPRPAQQTGNGGIVWLNLPAEVAAGAQSLARAESATPFMLLLTVFAAMLWRATGRRDLVIGVPVRGRDRAELEPIMGFFVNALPIPIALDPEQSLRENLRSVRKSVLAAFERPDLPIEQLLREMGIERDASRAPLFQVTFSYQDGRRRPGQWGNLRHQPNFVRLSSIAEDLGLSFVERDDGLRGALNYNADIYDQASIEALAHRFGELVERGLDAPARSVRELTAVTAAELQRLRAFNETEVAFTGASTIAQLLAPDQGAATEALALRFGNGVLSRAELERASNRIARALRERGIARGKKVGLLLERSPELVLGVIAVLKSGAAYVPLDPSFPAQRIAYMLSDSDADLVLCTSDLSTRYAIDAARCLMVDADAAAIERCADSVLAPDPELDPRGSDPAYLIYTSGSTGQPKGVVVSHAAVVNFLQAMRVRPGLAREDRLVAVTTLSFDIAVLELLLPLLVGAEIILASRDQVTDGEALRELIEQSEASVMQATPSGWRLLLDAGWAGGSQFKALCGGEPMPLELAAQLRSRCGSVWNMYGPTETTVWSTCWRVEQLERGVTVGTPIANTSVWILDEDGQLTPPGVVGEIWIGGRGVADGYHSRPELTRERFVADPYTPRAGAHLYRTGDAGRLRADGRLEHLGRLDSQVKLRGFRIELGEVEAAIGALPGVSRAVATVHRFSDGDTRLVAHLVAAGAEAPDEGAVRQMLRALLPDYMIPQHVLRLTSIPLLPNGKVDRTALPAPSRTGVEGIRSDRRAPRTETELQLAAVWREVLGGADAGLDDNFFDLGGHSMLVMQVIAKMKQRTGVRLGPRAFVFESLGQIARAYDESRSTDSVPSRSSGIVERLLGRLRGALSQDGRQ